MQVTDALNVGVQAIKDNHVTMAEVQTCLEEADEAISQQRETQTTLGTISSLSNFCLNGYLDHYPMRAAICQLKC